MPVSDAFANFSQQVFNRVLPPAALDPTAILMRAIGRRGIDPTFEPPGPSGRDIISAMRGRGDPLMTFNWYCELPILDNNVSLGWEYVEEGTLPWIEFEQQSNYRAGKMYHYPGHYSLGTLSLKFFENSRGKATQYLNAWQNMILVPMLAVYNHPAVYKKPIKFTIFDVYKLTAMFVTYEKCWPMRLDTYLFESAASNRINPNVEFSADDVVVQFAQYDPNQIPSIVDNITSTDSLARQTDVLMEAAKVLTDRVPLSF